MEDDATSARVLLVEDDPVLSRVYSRALTAAGYTVVVSADGAEGLERLLAEKYDVVVSDVCMPRMNGIDLLKDASRLRPNVPFVLMTAQLDAQLYDVARQMGTVRYLLKPMSMENLARAVRSAALLRAARLRAARASRQG
jgi:DNA-binding NtrC family response regulator